MNAINIGYLVPKLDLGTPLQQEAELQGQFAATKYNFVTRKRYRAEATFISRVQLGNEELVLRSVEYGFSKVILMEKERAS